MVFAGFASLRIPLTGVLILAIIAGTLGFIDARRRNELLFLQNLGVGPARVIGIWVATFLVLEVAIRLLATAVHV